MLRSGFGSAGGGGSGGCGGDGEGGCGSINPLEGKGRVVHPTEGEGVPLHTTPWRAEGFHSIQPHGGRGVSFFAIPKGNEVLFDPTPWGEEGCCSKHP